MLLIRIKNTVEIKGRRNLKESIGEAIWFCKIFECNAVLIWGLNEEYKFPITKESRVEEIQELAHKEFNKSRLK